ncbi:MAG: hypothetical protein BWY94_00791 [Actinobacteria bacterium ADurb.BinA094]|nr:MAG: hypothetical protein BWY94_00791 [Actinobacteria bacterium ADurb.BinA094]
MRDALLLAGAVQLGVLADGGDDLVALDDELGALDRHRAAAAGGVRLAQLHALHLDAGDLVALVREDAQRGAEQLELDALLLGLVDLGVVGRHLLARATVEAGDLFGAEAHGGAAGVHGGEAAADDGDLLAGVHRAVALEVPEVVDRGDHTGSVLTGDVHEVRVEGAEGEEDGVVLGLELLELEVDAQPHTGLELHAHPPEDVDLLLEDVAGQAVAGDAVAEHAARLGLRLEDLDGVALQARVEGGGEAGRPGPDDGDPLARVGLGLGRQQQLALELAGPRLVGHEAMQLADGDRVVDELPSARAFAGPRAHAAQDAGERQVLAQHPHAARVIAFRDALQETGDLDVGGAPVTTRRGAVRHVVAEDQLQVELTDGAQFGGLCGHDHAVGRGGVAGRDGIFAAFDLDDAQTTGRAHRQRLVEAEGGDRDPHLPGGREDAGALRHDGPTAVDRQRDRGDRV